MAKLPNMTIRPRFHAFDSWLIRFLCLVILTLTFWTFFENRQASSDFQEAINRFNGLSDRYETYIGQLEDGE